MIQYPTHRPQSEFCLVLVFEIAVDGTWVLYISTWRSALVMNNMGCYSTRASRVLLYFEFTHTRATLLSINQDYDEPTCWSRKHPQGIVTILDI
ncbi:hypothetical protein P692DRAFT_20237817 [Suillus brevipes Sb2]|nr:hypothetical protein P692DRAFT_20237817 [Suillus brevipes Sb2]